MTFYYIQAAALQWEAVGREIAHGRGEINLAVEPRLYGVLVRGNNIFEVAWLQRAQVRIHNRRSQFVLATAAAGAGKQTHADQKSEN